ncbi:hypothetical protein Rsub_00014 [Raphidocelis subcapitata]|uniref:F-box domain-containing protein n=1 Tax=Raphidocelis subcapitata TaxID=307507 RepID=A0A2V0NP71_9CHLO|nr:hypothetical protein Rsub_00014 [Raphidocelis subcapitata]|eukprot:GBF87303.1 hypothetical protein Rsub_00014 [Raphidocelis subcapitata]
MELDGASLLHVLSWLSPADVVACESACRALAALGRAPTLWAAHLKRDYGLELEGPGVPRLDLQTVYARLATGGAPAALRFLAAYTDGGTDGGDSELHYWADHAYLPNVLGPYCSDSPQDLTVVGLLKADPHPPDELRAEHRSYLIDRCKYAAAALFAPPGVQAPTSPEAAARMLATWSMPGLERLFADLFQDLVIHEHSTWGRHLLRDVPPERHAAETQRLRAAFQRVLGREELAAYRVQRIDYALVEEARAAAEAAPAPARGAAPAPAAAPAAASAAAPPAAPPAAAPAAPAASMARHLVVARHQVDAAVLPHMESGGAFGREVALVGELVVSRAGHFTCPVQCGALLFGMAPPTARGGGPEQEQPDKGEGQEGQEGAEPSWRQHAATVRRLVAMPFDPLCAALNRATSAAAVLAASAAGALPAVAAHHRLPGAEWIEFEPLPPAARRARAAAGWHAAPVVWFRFCPRAELPPDLVAAGQAALQQLAPGEDADDLMGDDGPPGLMPPDDDEGDEELVPAAAAEEEAAGELGAAADEEAAGDGGSEGVGGSEGLGDGGGVDDGSGSDALVSGGGDEGLPDLVAPNDGSGSDASLSGGGDEGLPDLVAPGDSGSDALVSGDGDEGLPDLVAPNDGSGSDASLSGDGDEGLPDLVAPDAMSMGSDSQSDAEAGSGSGSSGVESFGSAMEEDGAEGEAAGAGTSGAAAAGAPAGGPGAAGPSGQAAAAAGPSSRGRGRGGGGGGGERLPFSGPDRAPGFVVAPRLELAEVAHDGPEALVLRMRLARPRAGNVLMLKLVDQENLMREFQDHHDAPNIDVAYTAARGVAVKLPPGENLMREFQDHHDAPNIDVAYTAARGVAVKLPPGVEAAP